MHSLAASFLMLAVLTAPDADRADCGNVNDRYIAAVAKVAEAVRVYGACVATSAKQNDCAAEIKALDDAHDDFADAVADVKDCQ